MCGITAAIALDSISQSALNGQYREKVQQEMETSLERMRHRGPDSQNTWISEDNRVALGQSRLAINDLSPSGEQPFHSVEDDVHVIVNGELYMTAEERQAERLDTWHTFKGDSDCELVIPLYKKYGPRFLSRLRGEFALVLYDARRQHLYLARDRFGIKPLFWTIEAGRLLVSSEAKGLLSYGWQPKWDVKSLLDDGWMHDERTLFKNVRKVLPAHYMTCISFDYIESKSYWDITFPDKTVQDTRSEDEMIDGVRQQVREAVSRRLRADVPVGIYLSGGLDSSAVAGVAVSVLEEECAKNGRDLEEAKKLLKCFCLGFEEETTFDESSIAKRTADHLGLDFMTTRMDDTLFAEGFVEAAYHSEHHMPDLNHVGKYVLSDLAHRSGYKTILTGEGSDEHFGGYTLFYPDFMREPDLQHPSPPSLPTEMRQQISWRIEEGIRTQFKKFGVNRLDVVADAGTSGPGAEGDDDRAQWRRNFNDTSFLTHIIPLTCADFAAWTTERYGSWDPRETAVAAPDAKLLELINERWHPYNTTAYFLAKSGLANVLLTCLGDRTEMAHSIEGRPPFLDHHLAEFAHGLPPSVKIKFDPETGSFNEKWVLKEAMKPYLTEEMYKRKKHPFTAPPGIKIGGALHRVLGELVTQSNVEQLGFLDWKLIDERRRRALELGEDPSLRYILTVAQWVVLSQRFGIARAEPI